MGDGRERGGVRDDPKTGGRGRRDGGLGLTPSPSPTPAPAPPFIILLAGGMTTAAAEALPCILQGVAG